MRLISIFFLSLAFPLLLISRTISVGESKLFSKLQLAFDAANDGDSIIVFGGFYVEGNLILKKSVHLIGKNLPVVDGQKKYEILSVKANHVIIEGFRFQNSGFSSMTDPGAIKVYNSKFVTVRNNVLDDNFFGVYLQYCKNCVIENNTIKAYGIEEQQIGNGIHCWKSDSLYISGNTISGHRDGIYFEFVTNSLIEKNNSDSNIRYGLHFMFSNNDDYIENTFRNNGAGVAVMFTKHVKMINNIFEENWGDAAYGLLLKDISDSFITGNSFNNNTSGIYMEGVNRAIVENNSFASNGWGMKIQANCMDNTITSNNFINNTFDISTNGTLVLNTFSGNYWDKYEGYDLNRDNIGDVPYHPLSIFSVIVENNPPAMLLFRSFMVTLLDRSEKMIPSITPDNFVDNSPLMHSLSL